MKRRFVVQFECEIAIEQSLLDAVLTDEWRSMFYDLQTPGDVAEHLAFNMVQERKLSALDGFADQPEDAAVLGNDGLCNVDADEIIIGGAAR